MTPALFRTVPQWIINSVNVPFILARLTPSSAIAGATPAKSYPRKTSIATIELNNTTIVISSINGHKLR